MSSEAYRPENIYKRNRYWGQPYPHGVNDQDTACMIDIDEAGFKLESKDRNRGKVPKHKRANVQGKYKKGAGSVNLLMGVSGDEVDPFEFHNLYTGSLNTWNSIASWRILLNGWI
jgi:hypothetical protein